MNDHGQIVGYSAYRRGTTVEEHAYLRNGEFDYRELEPAGTQRSSAYAINNRGEVILSATPSEYGALLWRNGQFFPPLLPPSGVRASGGEALNASGQFVGWAVPNSPDPYCGCYDSYISNGVIAYLIAFPGAYLTKATAINDAGQVAGNYISSDDSGGFVWTNGQYQSVKFPGAATTITSIDGNGNLAGTYTIASPYERGSFVAIKRKSGSLPPDPSTPPKPPKPPFMRRR